MSTRNELSRNHNGILPVVAVLVTLLFSAFAIVYNISMSRSRAADWKYVRDLETKAALVDLSRTDLAAVCASYYSEPHLYHSILNAFDDNSNWINKINYTNWPGGFPQPWAEVQFDMPMVVTAVEIQGNRRFATTLIFKNGSRRSYPYSLANETIMEDTRVHMTPPSPQTGASQTYEIKAHLPLPEPGLDVVAVRFDFDCPQALYGNESMKVRDIRVLGLVPPGITYTKEKPRIAITRDKAIAIATEAYQTWFHAKLNGRTYCPVGGETEPAVEETPQTFIVTIRSIHGERRAVFRVVIDKKTGNIESSPVS